MAKKKSKKKYSPINSTWDTKTHVCRIINDEDGTWVIAMIPRDNG
jgi:hypothetical protein